MGFIPTGVMLTVHCMLNKEEILIEYVGRLTMTSPVLTPTFDAFLSKGKYKFIYEEESKRARVPTLASTN